MKLLDPICDMIVDVADARDQGLTMELGEREYAFCGHGCLVKFSKSPQQFIPKVEAWIAAQTIMAQPEHPATHAHSDELPTIDAGMRAWYSSCRCCLSDAYPKVVEALDSERAASAQQPVDAGICETAEGATPHQSDLQAAP
jgi:YHS domain-containing protein